MDMVTARKRLEQMRGELDNSIAVLRGEQSVDHEALDSPQDQADAGTSLSESDRSEAVLSRMQAQRGQVLDALQRLDEGTYGACADCGRPIPEGRLDARPEAIRCVACQAKRDRVRR